MTLALRGTIRAGVDRAFTRNGFVLIATFLVASLLQIGFIWLVTTTYLPLGSGTPVISTQSASPTPGTSPTLLVTVVSVFLVSLTGGLLSIPIQIVAIRTMVSKHTNRIPEEFVFHNMGWALFHTFFGSILVVILVWGFAAGGIVLSGFLLFSVIDQSMQMWLIGHWLGWIGIGVFVLVLLLPSIFLSLSLLFVSHEISIRDKNLMEAITGSWRCCRGNRLRLLVLVMFLFMLSIVISLIFNLGVPFATGFDTILVQAIVMVALSFVQVVNVAIMVRAYVSVNDDSLMLVAGESQQLS